MGSGSRQAFDPTHETLTRSATDRESTKALSPPAESRTKSAGRRGFRHTSITGGSPGRLWREKPHWARL
jgi:hypothetical protein